MEPNDKDPVSYQETDERLKTRLYLVTGSLRSIMENPANGPHYHKTKNLLQQVGILLYSLDTGRTISPERAGKIIRDASTFLNEVLK